MPFQLLRMIMIDSYCQGKIAELDLSGHLSVNGENGAGKTSLLRLIPLFFGEAPSRIVRSDAVMDRIGKFYFPSTTSYVVYEYQRRDEKVLAVLHADGATDNVVYRFIDSPYAPELFKDGDSLVPSSTLHRHVDKQGIFISKPLPLHVYRSVIQNTATRENRQLAAKFAFTSGIGNLANIEKVVTGILQKAATFFDLKQVIVATIVPGEADFSLKADRRELLQWINECDAYSTMMSKAPQMERLEIADQRHREIESELRVLHARAQLAAAYWVAQVQVAEAKEEESRKQRVTTEEQYAERIQVSNEKRGAAELAANTLRQQLLEIQSKWDAYEKNEAQKKAAEVASIPQLKKTLEDMEAQLRDCESAIKEASEIFGRMEQSARDARQAATAAIQTEHSALLQQQLEQSQALSSRRASELNTMQERHNDAIRQADESILELTAQESGLAVEVGNAQASPEFVEALRLAEEEVNAATALLEDLRDQSGELGRVRQSAKEAFGDLELMVAGGESSVEDATEALETLIAAGSASEDSLLGFLRRNKPEWASTIGKVASEDLLLNDQLSPTLAEGNDFYGVRLDLSRLDGSRFASEENLQREIAGARDRLTRKQKELEEDKKALAKQKTVLDVADKAIRDHEVKISGTKSRGEAARQRKAMAETRCQQSRESARRVADQALSACRTKLKDARDELTTTRRAHQQETNDFRSTFARIEAEAKEAFDARIIEFQRRSAAAERIFNDAMRQIAADRETALKEKGISPDVVKRIRKEIGTTSDRISAADANRVYVAKYNDWVESVWPTKPGIETSLVTADAAAAERKAEHSALLRERTTALAECSKEIEAANRAVDEAHNKQKRADGLVAQMTLWAPDQKVLEEGTDQFTDIQALAADRSRLSGDLESERRTIKDGVEDVRRAMMLVPGSAPEALHTHAVKQFGYPQQGSEHHWLGVFRGWFSVEHAEHRSVLVQRGRTISQKISDFWKKLNDFQSKINSFSNELKVSLDQNSVFDSLSSISVEVSAQIDTQNYATSVKRLHDEYDAWHSLSESSLPPPSFIASIRAVAEVLNAETGLVADPADLIALKVGAALNGGPVKVATNEQELKHISSNGFSYIILCIILAGFINRIRGKQDVIVPFVVDELGDLSLNNATAMVKMFECNRLIMVSAEPTTDFDLAEFFKTNYKILPLAGQKRKIGIVHLNDDEVEVAHV